jgi:hypothetical protein
VHELPSLSREQVYAAITYYLRNKPQVDEYMADIERFVEEQVRRQEAPPTPCATAYAL